jgi:hypothetical protein
MSDIFFCSNQARRLTLQRQTAINGVDFLEVIDGFGGLPRQQVLLVHLFVPMSGTALGTSNIALTGGSSVTVHVSWAYSGTQILNATTSNVPPGVASSELNDLQNLIRTKCPPTSPPSSPPTAATDALLVVHTDRPGDFAPYRLSLVTAPNNTTQPSGYDLQLRFVDFTFKAACPTDIDCAEVPCAPSTVPVAPELDYLTKDYAGFRQLMLDRLAVVAPDLLTSNPADLAVVLVELLAHAADKASYFQDAVATEAYLGTAQRRRSVRRHARLLDYQIGEGSNARTFVRFTVDPTFVSTTVIPRTTQLLTKDVVGPFIIGLDAARIALASETPVFETMHDLTASRNLNEILFYTWGDDQCCLPAGSTRATLNNTGNVLAGLMFVGMLLAFGEVLGPASGLPQDADPAHRQVVRLTSVTFRTDPLYLELGSPTQAQRVVDIEWSVDDALSFTLCISAAPTAAPVSVAWGNIAIADHGLTVEDIPGGTIPTFPIVVTVNPSLLAPVGTALFEPTLAKGPLVWQGQVKDSTGTLVTFDPAASAASIYGWQSGDVSPAITSLLDGFGSNWTARRDLLESDALSQDFVVETEDDGSIELRFGDGTLGREPTSQFSATYRIGNALEGNVGADTITHLVASPIQASPQVVAVTNPVPARGGTAPETLDHVRINAPEAFRVQMRAVTTDDYAAAAQLNPDVQRAHAVRTFTGSWYTIFIAIDRFGGRAVDAAFQAQIRATLEPLRMAGHDFVVVAATSVPLEIALPICVSPGFIAGDVRERLDVAFSAGVQQNGQPGFFNPDNFTFGQPIYLSQVLAVASNVLGVASIDTSSNLIFRRSDQPQSNTGDPTIDDVIRVGPGEVIRVDNDINQPQNGKITFILQGGA